LERRDAVSGCAYRLGQIWIDRNRGILLVKTENSCYTLMLADSGQAGGRAERGESVIHAFADGVKHNLRREPRKLANFFIFFACNPLKRLDSEK
jgi:hypothetical protein